MQITMSQWPRGALSPLIFMVDDLANIFFNSRGGDWGGKKLAAGGMYDFLKRSLLHEFPWIKFTFFLVTSVRAPQVYGYYDHVNPCTCDGFPEFLKALESDGHEIAYHGTTHGQVKNEKFIQEWDSFGTLLDALNTIDQGKKLYVSALDHPPYGGKYCGYLSGKFGHQSVLRSGFLWWFDRWDDDVEARPRGEWRDGIFYFPSNVDCSHYSPLMLGRVPLYKYFKSIYRMVKNGSPHKRINKILEAQGIITLQEHSSPTRTDNKRQYPNIVNDLAFIKSILRKLKKHNIWYATATDVFFYEKARSELKIEHVDNKLIIISPTATSYPPDFKITLTVPQGLRASVWECESAKFSPYTISNQCYIDIEAKQFNTQLTISI